MGDRYDYEQIKREINNYTEKEAKVALINLISTHYTLIKFPDSISFEKREWFKDNAIPVDKEIYGEHAYLIPTRYYVLS